MVCCYRLYVAECAFLVVTHASICPCSGTKQVSGLEYRHIRGLAVHLPAGAKIAVKDVMIRRGNLLLTPENTVVLGGQVDELEAARQKALKRWNQPATGRTSRHEAGAVDLYAEASAAAWQEDNGPARAPRPGSLPGPGSRSAPSQPSVAQPRSGDLPTTGSTSPITGSTPKVEQTLPHRPVLPAVRSALAMLPQPQDPALLTPLDHPQLQPQPNQRVTHAAFCQARSNTGRAATQLQATVNGGYGTSRTPLGSENGTELSNPSSRHSTLPSATLDETGAAHRSLAAPEHHLQLPRSRLALSQAATPAQQSAGRPEVPPQAGHTPSSATADVTPNQPQQDLIVIDDSPQLPNLHSQPHHLSDALCDDPTDAHGRHGATQPGKRQRRQLLESSSDSDSEAAPAKAARTASGSGKASGQPQQEQAADGGNSIDAHPAMGRLDGGVATDIIPDSSADVGGMPQQYEDYGNEPVYDEDFEEPDEVSPPGANVSGDADPDRSGDEPLHALSHLEDNAAARPAIDSPIRSLDGNQPMAIADSPGCALGSGEAAGDNRAGDAIRATEALFNPPFTTLSSIAQYVPQMPASEFPMTLRINGRLGNPLCNLLFKDSQGHPLDEYSINMELSDSTLEGTATVGHDILLQAVGIPPADFCAKFMAGRKPAVQPFLQQMGAFMSRYSGSAMLMDVRITAPTAQLVIVHIHQQWTKADREAMQPH